MNNLSALIIRVDGVDGFVLPAGSVGFLEFKPVFDSGKRVLSEGVVKDEVLIFDALASYDGCRECAGEAKEVLAFINEVVFPVLAAGGVVELKPQLP